MTLHKHAHGILETQSLPTAELFKPSENLLTYEQQLSRDREWALAEASRYFDEKSAVFQTLKKISQKFDEMQVSYAIVGGMALFQHGFRRFTEDVDILVTKETLKRIHTELDGLGYLPPHSHSKHLRDTETGVRIEFLTTGDFPGDGKPKPVSFPDPQAVSTEVSGTRYVNLPTLIELKLASGMSSPNRRKDLADVQELIKILELPRDYAKQLDGSVQPMFEQLWNEGRQRFILLWRNKWLTSEATSLAQMADRLQAAADELKSMLANGVILESVDGVSDESATLVTFDPAVARKFDMVEESEYWPDSDESN